MDWLMFWFWIGVGLILAAALVPNEEYNWVVLLRAAIDNFLAKREAKKYPDFAARWKEYCAKEDELEKFYHDKIEEARRQIRRYSPVLARLEPDDFRRGIIEEALKKDQEELSEYETLFLELSNELNAEFDALREEKRKLGIKYL